MTTTAKEEPKHTDEKQKAPEYTPDHPEFPKVMYNVKTRTVVTAKDKDDEDKIKAKGYTEDPYPPLGPDAMTTKDMQELESLLHKQLAEISKSAQAESASAAAAEPAQVVPGAVAYSGATGAKDAGTTGATGHAASASGKPPAK